MVAIRNGDKGIGYRSRRSPFWIAYLPNILSMFLVSSVSFYGGVLLGLQMDSCPSSAAAGSDNNGNAEDFDARVREEVARRMASESTGRDDKPASKTKRSKTDKKKDDGRQRRFPKTISKIASGASLISKNDFLSKFDYGIPKPPSKRDHESDPGKDDVLLLYSTEKALPDVSTGVVYTNEDGNDASIPHMSAQDATKNCGGLNVIFTETRGDVHQCIAIVGNYESYHIQRWLRISPDSGSKMDEKLPLAAVGRGMQSNGMDKFSAPSDEYAMQNQALLETYFDRLKDTLEALKPMAKACAGTDNTVIVMVCNTGQSDLLINFICSSQARGFGEVVKEKVLVFATDEGVLKIARALGLRVFYDEKVRFAMPFGLLFVAPFWLSLLAHDRYLRRCRRRKPGVMVTRLSRR
ncbi:hypothetical protein ACHAWF_005735 [Thalassiosira exigua]